MTADSQASDDKPDKPATGMTRKEVAQRFGVSVSAVRSWQRNFKAWLEVEKSTYGGRQQATTYGERDLLVFSVVQRLTDEGLTYDDIRARMDEELARATPADIPGQEERQEEPQTALISWQRYAAVVADLQGERARREVLEDNVEWLRSRIGELEDKLADTQQQLIEEAKKTWWQRLRGK